MGRRGGDGRGKLRKREMTEDEEKGENMWNEVEVRGLTKREKWKQEKDGQVRKEGEKERRGKGMEDRKRQWRNQKEKDEEER